MGEPPNMRIDHIFSTIRPSLGQCFCENDPMPWYRALTGLAPHTGIEDPEIQQKMGERTALRVLRRTVTNLANAANM